MEFKRVKRGKAMSETTAAETFEMPGEPLSEDDGEETPVGEAPETDGSVLEGAVPVGPTTTNGLSAAEMELVRIPVEEIMPDPLNPNEETPEKFNTLVNTISEDGWDQPVVVCPISDQERPSLQAPPEVKYVLAKGEHRWRAARVLGHRTVPAVVREWDTLTRRTRLVRDNTVRGDLNKKKFTELVHSMQAEHSLDSELASAMLGFDNSKEMFSLMVKDQAQKDLEGKTQTNRAKDELKVLDDLSLVLNTLFTKHGHTLPYGYMVFMWAGKINAMVEMDEGLTAQVEELAQISLDRKVNMSILLAQILRDGMAPYRTE
jgi:ParB/RepB/Spo0J family partition protein